MQLGLALNHGYLHVVVSIKFYYWVKRYVLFLSDGWCAGSELLQRLQDWKVCNGCMQLLSLHLLLLKRNLLRPPINKLLDCKLPHIVNLRFQHQLPQQRQLIHRMRKRDLIQRVLRTRLWWHIRYRKWWPALLPRLSHMDQFVIVDPEGIDGDSLFA